MNSIGEIQDAVKVATAAAAEFKKRIQNIYSCISTLKQQKEDDKFLIIAASWMNFSKYFEEFDIYKPGNVDIYITELSTENDENQKKLRNLISSLIDNMKCFDEHLEIFRKNGGIFFDNILPSENEIGAMPGISEEDRKYFKELMVESREKGNEKYGMIRHFLDIQRYLNAKGLNLNLRPHKNCKFGIFLVEATEDKEDTEVVFGRLSQRRYFRFLKFLKENRTLLNTIEWSKEGMNEFLQKNVSKDWKAETAIISFERTEYPFVSPNLKKFVFPTNFSFDELESYDIIQKFGI